MKEILEQISQWLSEGQSIALATVIKTWGSSPRPVGSRMAICQDSRIAGSVSGGCVEAAVIQSALEVIASGQAVRLQYGVGDAQAWEVGLACGGEIEVFVRPFLGEDLQNWDKALRQGGTICAATLVGSQTEAISPQEFFLFADGQESFPELPPAIKPALVSAAEQALQTGRSSLVSIQPASPLEAFLHVIQPALELIVVGGVHIAIPLVELARVLGFEVTVVDPRRLFSTAERFPGIRLIPEWPGKAFQKIQLTRSSAVVMLTHDPKIDDPALEIALASQAFYVGALGSKKTHQNRLERLKEAGIPDQKLASIHAPIGLDLGGRSPQEIALAILAEVIQVWNNLP